jgi:trans-4-hydroxy-L-proline dehydratase
MIERIAQLAKLTVSGKMWVEPVKTDYDRMDLFLSPVQMSAKRAYEYILNQEPMITEYSAMTGFLTFDGSVEGDIFNRPGHRNFQALKAEFYAKPVDNLSTMEWQHSTGDFGKIIRGGIAALETEIKQSRQTHTNPEEVDFLDGMQTVCDAIGGWAAKCSMRAEEKAKDTVGAEYRRNLLRLADALKRVPHYPAQSFYESVLCVYICYPFINDGIGLADRYLYPLYRRDVENGVITQAEAASYLQELFLMLQARIHVDSDRFHRGGESHFCIGGYLPNDEDGFNDLSRLIVDSLMELPTWIPQISLRWTRKTPHDVLAYMMDCERHDNNKRIAFVNDEPHIRAWENITGLSHDDAVSYTMVGCNEPAFPGGILIGSADSNIVRSMANTFHQRGGELKVAQSFEDFYRIYEEELRRDIKEMIWIDDAMNAVRSRDCNLISSPFFRGCIENAKSMTQGGATFTVATLSFIGTTTVIDSLSVVKQFVFDEKIVTIGQLVDAVCGNWVGYEDLHTRIRKEGHFFGNDDETSNAMAQRFFASATETLKDKTNYLGNHYVLGNLIGYNQHNVWFGNATTATPDGRYDGDPISFGHGQSDGRDRCGLPALLNSVAKSDPEDILSGPSVTNIMLDEQIVRNEDSFQKLVDMMETYLHNGGIHFQLSYVSREDMINAQITPEKYASLRVRVSGFSDYFTNLNRDLQDEIITRTSHVR